MLVPERSQYSREAYRTQWIQRRKTYRCWDSDYCTVDGTGLLICYPGPSTIHGHRNVIIFDDKAGWVEDVKVFQRVDFEYTQKVVGMSEENEVPSNGVTGRTFLLRLTSTHRKSLNIYSICTL